MLLGGNIIKLRMYGGLLGELFYYTSPDHQTDYQSMLECYICNANFQAQITASIPSRHLRIALILLEASEASMELGVLGLAAYGLYLPPFLS